MIRREQSLAELNKEAWQVLIKELGVVKATRFLRQFDIGSGSYSTDRDKWQEGLTVEQVTRSIEHRKQQKPRRQATKKRRRD